MSKTRKKYVQFRNLIGFICNVMEVWWWSKIDIIILLTMPIQLTTYKEIIVISVRGQSKGQLASSTDSEQVKWKRCRIIVSAIWTSRLSSPFSILLFVQKRKKKAKASHINLSDTCKFFKFHLLFLSLFILIFNRLTRSELRGN